MRSPLLNSHLRWLRSILLLLVSGLLICSPQVIRHVYASDLIPRLFLPTIYHPDVTRIAFETLSILSGDPASQIDVIPAIGGTPVTLPNGCGGFAIHPSWSPDATEIAFVFGSRTNPTAGGVCIARADGSHAKTIVRGLPVIAEGSDLAWSPDGATLVFNGASDASMAPSHLFRVQVDGSNLQQLTHGTANEWSPSWSPTSQEVVYVTDRVDAPGLYRMHADGSQPQLIAGTSQLDDSPAWSPDGTRIAFASRREAPFGDSWLYVMNVDGSGVVRIASSPALLTTLFAPAWSVDGSQIVFTVEDDMRRSLALELVDVATGVERSLDTLDTAGSLPAWSHR